MLNELTGRRVAAASESNDSAIHRCVVRIDVPALNGNRWLPKLDTSRTFARFLLPETTASIRRFKTLAANTRILRAMDPAKVDRLPRSDTDATPSSTGGSLKTAKASKTLSRKRPSLRERAVGLAQAKGEVRTKELTNIGVHRCYLTRMCEEGLLVKVGYGRYRAARVF